MERLESENLTIRFFSKSELVNSSSEFEATIGNFDGVHIGHQEILKKLISSSIKNKRYSLVITFSPSPTKFLFPENAKAQLISDEEKVQLLMKSGVDAVAIVEFNSKLANLSAKDFCQKIFNNVFKIEKVFVGYDFRFGKDRIGNFIFLSEFLAREKKEVEQIGPVKLPQGDIVSSSLVREAVVTGNMFQAKQLLGRYFYLSGKIVHGDAKGRDIGFPTANLAWESELPPAPGIYACFVEVLEDAVVLPGVLSCGFRPIVGKDLHLQIEAYIFEFSGNLYDKKCKFHFVSYIREERPFENWEKLKEQIRQDCEKAKAILSAENFARQS